MPKDLQSDSEQRWSRSQCVQKGCRCPKIVQGIKKGRFIATHSNPGKRELVSKLLGLRHERRVLFVAQLIRAEETTDITNRRLEDTESSKSVRAFFQESSLHT